MSRVTLYEYDGETRRESGVSVNWRQVLEPIEFDASECNFDEALNDHVENRDGLDWHGPWRAANGVKVYEVVVDDSPLCRAEVEE